MDLSSLSILLLFSVFLVYGVLEVEAPPPLDTKDQPYEAPSHHFKLHKSFKIGVASVDPESPPSPSASVVVTEASGLLVTSRPLLSKQPPSGRVLVESEGGSPRGALRVFVIVLLSSVLAVIFLVFIFLICFERRRPQDYDGEHVNGPTPPVAEERGCCQPARTHPSAAPPVADERGCCQPARTHPSAAPPVADKRRGGESVPTRPSGPAPIGHERRSVESVPNRASAPPVRTHGESAPTRPRRGGGSVPTHDQTAAAPAGNNGKGDGRPPRAHQSTAPIANGRPPRVRKDVPQEVSLPVMSNPDPGNVTQQPSASTTVHDIGFRVFKYRELLKATDGFLKTNCLGEGGSATVFKAVLPGGKIVAVKLLNKENFNRDIDFRREVNVISVASHIHIVSLIGYCIHDDERLIVMEFVANNSLHHYLRGGDGIQVLNWPQRMKIALGTAKGLVYLHEECSRRIIHRDVKPANILLGNDFQAKVADFGLAKLCSDSVESHILTNPAGTPGYVDPVYFQTAKLTVKTDVYSFGVVLLGLISGCLPPTVHGLVIMLPIALKKCNFDTLADPRLQKSYDTHEMSLMVTCADACLRKEPNDRPVMKQIAHVLEGIISPAELKKRN